MAKTNFLSLESIHLVNITLNITFEYTILNILPIFMLVNILTLIMLEELEYIYAHF